MTSRNKQKLTLDWPTAYQIKVPGKLDESMSDWEGQIRVTVDYGDDGLPMSTLTGTFDQAALLGMLRRLYSLGIPLISVICIDID